LNERPLEKVVMPVRAQVVMCSGVMADGSLRIVRNGIGMIEQARAHACLQQLPRQAPGCAGCIMWPISQIWLSCAASPEKPASIAHKSRLLHAATRMTSSNPP
jgi:hypothetical protein